MNRPNINNFISIIKPHLRNPRTIRIAGSLLVLFLLANIVISMMYRDRTYPNTTVAGHHLGSVSAGGLVKKVQSLPLIPKEVRFAEGKDSAKAAVASFGIQADYPAIRQQALQQRSWLPLANLITSHDIPLILKTDKTKLQKTVASALPAFQHEPVDAKIERQGDKFAIKAEITGQKVDTQATARQLLASLQSGKASVPVAVEPVKAAVAGTSLQKPLDQLNTQVKTGVTLSHGDKTKQFKQAEVASWYVPDKSTMVLSEPSVHSAVAATGADFGINVQNQDEAADAIETAIKTNKKLSYTLVATPPAAKIFSYCTAVRGVDQGEIPALVAKLKQTFADNRGWNLGGPVGYQYDPTGATCDFTVWLSAADQMPTYGAICDAEWSCMVSPNVIINYDRWRYASPAWAALGGSLEDYRTMVINHETGHWLGFGHAYCPATGQAAPVMQQQSIDLQGCSFNPWPTAGEQAILKQRLGL